MSFPNKEQRAKCWTSRDNYWQCLNEKAPEHCSTSGEAVPNACKHLRKLFEKNCSAQWVKHFDRKRTYDQFKERLTAGYDPLEENKQTTESNS